MARNFMLCPGFPGYRVGDDGSVQSCWERGAPGPNGGGKWVIGSEWRELKPKPEKKTGYLTVELRRDGKKHYRRVHRLVLEAFVGPRPAGLEALHGDGDPANNRRDNLRWGTRLENVADMMRHGRHRTPLVKGHKLGPKTAIPTDTRAEIRRRHAAGETLAAIIPDFGICLTTAWAIVCRRGCYKE